MNQRAKRFSLTNLSYTEEIEFKLQQLGVVRHTTNAMIAQFDLHPKSNTKRKTSIQQKSFHAMAKRRTLQPLLRLSTQNKSLTDKFLSDMKFQALKTPMNSTLKSNTFYPPVFNDHHPLTSHSITPPVLNSPTNDEHFTTHPSIDSEQIPINDKSHHHSQEDSQISESSYRKYRTTHSIISSSSTSKNSHDEPPSPLDTLIIGKLYILNEIYPSIEYEKMNGTPLAFLGSEKLLRIHIDWTNVRYPLSAYHIELIIDLIIIRPSFIREIPKVTEFNLYRSLNKIISGRLFFDHGKHRAGIHRCNRKQINRKFTIQDLASIHRREFYIINYNVTREQRFINLYDNLFQIHVYQTKSTHYKTYLIKPKRPENQPRTLNSETLSPVIIQKRKQED